MNPLSEARRCAGSKSTSGSLSGCSASEKTMEVEILREALAKSEVKKTELAALVAAEGRFPMKAVAETLEVAGSHLHEKVRRPAKPRGYYRKPDDLDLLPLVRRLIDERPTYGYRRITALDNRERVKAGKPPRQPVAAGIGLRELADGFHADAMIGGGSRPPAGRRFPLRWWCCEIVQSLDACERGTCCRRSA